MNPVYLKLVLSAFAIALIAVHLIWPDVEIDAITLGLAVFAALPWLPSILESAEFPGGWKVKFRELEQKQDQQQSEIDTLRFLVGHFLTADELGHLKKLASGEAFPFTKDGTASYFEKELRRLRALGLIAGHPGKGIRSLFKAGDDVKRHFYITEQGKQYLKLREQIDSDQVAPEG